MKSNRPSMCVFARAIHSSRLAVFALLLLLLGACQAPVYTPNQSAGGNTAHTLPASTIPKPPAQKKQASKSSTAPYQQSQDIISKALGDEQLQPPPSPSAERSQQQQTTPASITSRQVIQRNQNSLSAGANSSKKTNDGSGIPAFNQLIKLGIKQLRAGNLIAAEQQFTQAQRLGPQSPAPYMYLSEIAIKRGQATKAENMARRGLLVSRSVRYDKALWKMVEISGKMRNRADIVNEAQMQLNQL